jgi:hypothetical protein
MSANLLDKKPRVRKNECDHIKKRKRGVFEVAKLQSFLQTALPPTNCSVSKGLTIVMAPTSGMEMGKSFPPLQSLVLGEQ